MVFLDKPNLVLAQEFEVEEIQLVGGCENLAPGLGVRMEELEESPRELGMHAAIDLIYQEDPFEFGEVDQYGYQVKQTPCPVRLLPDIELDRAPALDALVAHDQLVALHHPRDIPRETEAARGGIEDRHRFVVGQFFQYLGQERFRHQPSIGNQ